MKRLTREGDPITHRDVELQVGLDFKTYSDNVNNYGEDVHTKYHPDYEFNVDHDGMMWQLLEDM